MPIRTLEGTLASWANRAVSEVNVSLPGVVLDYDTATQTATVRPVVREAFEDDDERIFMTEFEPIPSVPVAHWRAGGFTMHAPLLPGDIVTLVVSDRSIDEFMATGNTDNIPQVLRRFDWSDAVAIPMPPAPTPLEGLSETDFFLGVEDGAAGVRMTPVGTMRVEAAGDELFQTLLDLIDNLVTSITGMGATTFDPASQTQLLAIKTRLLAMRG
jgi:hypothetical protein